jgi:hypothetical protein
MRKNVQEEYIRRIPPSIPSSSKRAFSNYILPFSSSISPQILPVVSHRLQKCILVKLVKFNYTTIGYELLLPVTRLRGLMRGYRCFDKSIKSKLLKNIFTNLITSAIQTRIVLIDCYCDRPTTTTTYTTRTTTTTNATMTASTVDMVMKE